MNHLQEFRPRTVLALSVVEDRGWRLKQYAILSKGREFDGDIAAAAGAEAINRLPKSGSLADSDGNHGVGFQIIHFAEVAVVSPVFYWQWGSVLAHIDQLRAPWDNPTAFADGVRPVIGCVWEMDIVNFELDAWKTAMLTPGGSPDERLARYLKLSMSR